MTKDDALVALDCREKIRFHTWWWGRYIHKPGKHILSHDGQPFELEDGYPADGWEIYDERAHGAHNAE